MILQLKQDINKFDKKLKKLTWNKNKKNTNELRTSTFFLSFRLIQFFTILV